MKTWTKQFTTQTCSTRTRTSISHSTYIKSSSFANICRQRDTFRLKSEHRNCIAQRTLLSTHKNRFYSNFHHMETSAAEHSKAEEEWEVITEGKASMLCPKGKNQVFYNPAQETNRDISIIMIKQFQEQWKKEQQNKPIPKKGNKGARTNAQQQENNTQEQSQDITILEALAATGLRSIRYIKEIPGIKNIVVNDIDAAAVEAIVKNMEYNKVEAGKLIPNKGDASMVMYQHREEKDRFQVVDLDPYGSAATFLDAAVQAVADGGLLCVTCTDMGVLCGNHAEVCWSKYGSLNVKGKYCHEMALRILLASIESHCNRYKRYIVPILSMHIDFYVRVFVRVYTSPSEVKKSPTKLTQVYQCTGCDCFWLQPLVKVNENSKTSPATLAISSTRCTECGRSLKFGGPIWAKPMHDAQWVSNILTHLDNNPKTYGQHKKIYGLLSVIKEELHDVPLFYVIDSLCNTLHCTVPRNAAFRSALKRLGYNVSSSHANPKGIKTNAPNDVIWDVLRCWYKLHPGKNLSETSPAAAILAKQSKIEADFTVLEDTVIERKKGVPRFVENPENWGPKTRAKGKKRATKDESVERDLKKQKSDKNEENQ